MKIRKIWIKGHNQFKDTFIDFTNPTTGEAVDKVCFIGKNGTGKSTLLRLIKDIIIHITKSQTTELINGILFAVELNIESQNIIYFNKSVKNKGSIWSEQFFLDTKITELRDWLEYIVNANSEETRLIREKYESPIRFVINNENIYKVSKFVNNASDLLIYSPSEGLNNSYLEFDDVPVSDINTALGLFADFPFYHEVSNESVNAFWTLLIYSIKQRQEEKEKFETKDENINKTKKDLIVEFDEKFPKILNEIARIWDKILAHAGLFFDVNGANNPIQLNDNLYAYVREKGTDKAIDYNYLSTGIRNFIFRIGHIYSLYFNREIKKGIVLIDEPENSLFPDFLYDLIETYQSVFIDKNGENNTQLFVATHSPIIAAQFEPHERIILEWDEPGSVKAEKGKAPAGDDPNDILQKDFGIAHLMGKRGEEMWKEYLDMKRKLRHTTDQKEKEELVEKITHLGTEYNF